MSTTYDYSPPYPCTRCGTMVPPGSLHQYRDAVTKRRVCLDCAARSVFKALAMPNRQPLAKDDENYPRFTGYIGMKRAIGEAKRLVSRI